MARFNVVIPRADGGVELYPMKQWFRQHSERLPEGLDPTLHTSHQLRNGLRKAGWIVQATPDEVRLTPPGSAGSDEAVAAVLGEENETADEPLEDAAFRFEVQLRDFIAQNLGSIDVSGHRLTLYVDAEGRTGVEYPTAVGPIDILAVDGAGNFYVFELKRARSPDHAIGQLTRYMGCLWKEFGPHHQVNGIIVAREITASLRYAIAVIPNVSLFEYEVQFKLRRAETISSGRTP